VASAVSLAARATNDARDAPVERGGGEAQADTPSTLAPPGTSPQLKEAAFTQQGDEMAGMGELTQGMKVKSSDGASLGKIIRIEPEFFIVEKGFFFPKDFEISIALVSSIRDDECWLSLSREDLEREGRGEASFAQTDELREGEQRMELSEEELEARKRVREAGEVAVRKEVVTERRQVDVPVTKEEVHVERVPASASQPSGGAFEEKEIRVPIREEEVEVTKRPRVREEVRVSRTARQDERRVEGDVRREEAKIEGKGEVEKGGYGVPPDDET
jgi:uncharacterized protein (TIGR02271 family)